VFLLSESEQTPVKQIHLIDGGLTAYHTLSLRIFLFSAGSIKQSFEVSEDEKTPCKLDVYCSFCTTESVPAAFVLSMMCLRPIYIDRTVEATFQHPKT